VETGQSRICRILLADDHPLVRQALREVLEREPDLEIVGEAANGQQAVEMAQEFEPDIVIMDISMPVLNGIEATKRIKALVPSSSILILTVHDDIETIFSILQLGASGYLTKGVFSPEVIHTVRAVMAGDVVLAPEVSDEVVRYALQHATKPVKIESFNRVTPKEMQILSLAAKGLSNKEIAVRLQLSEGTVKSYFVGLFQKMNVRSRTEAVFVGLKSGILNLDDLR
jgi:two-component system, NarL family, response regulator LiaR